MKKALGRLFLAITLMISVGYANTISKTGIDESDIIDSDLIVKDTNYKLVFFGYAGCYHFCDPRLRQIDLIYKKIKDHIDVKMLFIDISEESTLDDARLFVKDVNKEFEAIDPDSQSITLLQKKFQDVFIRKMPDGEYVHSGFLYLLKKEKEHYYLLKTYLEFSDTDTIIADIKNITFK